MGNQKSSLELHCISSGDLKSVRSFIKLTFILSKTNFIAFTMSASFYKGKQSSFNNLHMKVLMLRLLANIMKSAVNTLLFAQF